jgi:hypothetical protein
MTAQWNRRRFVASHAVAGSVSYGCTYASRSGGGGAHDLIRCENAQVGDPDRRIGERGDQAIVLLGSVGAEHDACVTPYRDAYDETGEERQRLGSPWPIRRTGS